MERYIYKVVPEEATYDNWWNGDVVLIFSTLYHNNKEKPLTVDWSDFSVSDADKIKDMQREIYEEEVSSHFKKLCDQFIKRYEFSEMKLEYLRDEMRECKTVLSCKIPDVKIVHLKHWETVFPNKYLLDVQNYFKRTIKKGIDDGLSFIHSPNCKYQDKSITDSRIYARFVWKYFKWLLSFAKGEKTDNVLQKVDTEIINLKKEQISEPIVESKSPIDDYEINKKRFWFIVGLLFANGEMDKLIGKHKKGTATNCTAIANELGNRNLRPYISESISNRSTNDKNIFKNVKKINFIKRYCEKENITIVDSFEVRINTKN